MNHYSHLGDTVHLLYRPMTIIGISSLEKQLFSSGLGECTHFKFELTNQLIGTA